MGRARWNHNLHYHPLLVTAVPSGGRVLDVGCGEGMLTRELAGRARSVLGVDLDASSIELARATTSEANVEFLCADVLQHPFEPASFDAVVSVATLHHLGTEAGLLRLRQLVRPGGVLGIIGLASSEWPRDLPRDIAAAIATRIHRLVRGVLGTLGTQGVAGARQLSRSAADRAALCSRRRLSPPPVVAFLAHLAQAAGLRLQLIKRCRDVRTAQ